MALIKEYFELTEKYMRQYNNRLFLLIQVGGFYEMYGMEEPDGTITGSLISEFGRLTDFAVNRKGSTRHNNKPVRMSGIPFVFLEKHIPKLLSDGYTIAVIDQDAQVTGTTRTLRCVYSSGTSMDNPTEENLSNDCCCIWINKYISKPVLSIGCCSIDVLTGKSIIFEYETENINSPTTFDDLERFISSCNPSECIIISELSQDDTKNIPIYANIKSRQIHLYIKESAELSDIKKKEIANAENQKYQKEILERHFSDKTVEEVFPSFYKLGTAGAAYCYLLEFVNSHNPDILHKITPPVFENKTDRVFLGNHSLKQLNIIDDGNPNAHGKASSVLSLLNRCVTNMGKRRFKYRILNPTNDVKVLEREYDIVEHLIANSDIFQIKHELNSIKDVENIKRKIMTKRVSPCNFVSLLDSIKIITDLFDRFKDETTIFNYINTHPGIVTEKFLENCSKLINHIKRTINIELAIDINNTQLFETNFINTKIHAELDNKEREITEGRDKLQAIRKELDRIIFNKETTKRRTNTTQTEYIKEHKTQSDFYIYATQTRCAILQSYIKHLEQNNKPTDIAIKYQSSYDNQNKDFVLDLTVLDFDKMTKGPSNIKISSERIKEICNQIMYNQIYINQLVGNVFNDFVLSTQVFDETLENIVEFISCIDILHNKMTFSKRYNYCKPVIRSNENGKSQSYVNAIKLRHCLIEHLNKDEIYKTNDISLGKDEKGVLLYGTNAVGKTSLIRSIGISVIMAQAGCFVPCESFDFYPYTNIFTRIVGNDNIFKGLSTFAVEMNELCTILKYSDSNSLILGDELCSGTEIASAFSIFIRGIQELYKRESSFIFATHLHEITNVPEITEMKRVVFKHLTVRYDRETRKLIFDRILREGAGDNTYGIEFCKSLHFPSGFIDEAQDIRNKYYANGNSILSLNTTRYNNDKLQGTTCEICNISKGVETHHLQYQHLANDNNYINESFNKDHPANLCSICHDCHEKIHKDGKQLVRKRTSSGFIFEYC